VRVNEPHGRALLAVATAARETADAALAIACDLPVSMTTRERIRAWRRVRVLALTGLDRCVLAELLAGADWVDAADGYGLSVDEMKARFGPTLEVWSRVKPPAQRPDPTGEFSVGLPYDSDPAGAAQSLDQWVNRHAEPWQEVGLAPVSTALGLT
jgi:hypothetical protein